MVTSKDHIRELRARISAAQVLHSGDHWCCDSDGNPLLYAEGGSVSPCPTLLALTGDVCTARRVRVAPPPQNGP
jgi:hypothetical protein